MGFNRRCLEKEGAGSSTRPILGGGKVRNETTIRRKTNRWGEEANQRAKAAIWQRGQQVKKPSDPGSEKRAEVHGGRLSLSPIEIS